MSVVTKLESKRCPNSTDGGGKESNHKIGPDGFCSICDRSIRALASMHGLTEWNGM